MSKSGDTITASWDFEPGCVPIALADVAFAVDWRVLGQFSSLIEYSDTSSCGTNGNRLTCTYDYSFVPVNTFIVGVSIVVIPDEKKYREVLGAITTAVRAPEAAVTWRTLARLNFK